MKMEPTECSETSAFSTQAPGKYPKENALHTKHGESLKSRNLQQCFPKLLLADVAHLEGRGGITMDPHTLVHVNTERPDDRCSELKTYILELISDSYQYIPVA